MYLSEFVNLGTALRLLGGDNDHTHTESLDKKPTPRGEPPINVGIDAVAVSLAFSETGRADPRSLCCEPSFSILHVVAAATVRAAPLTASHTRRLETEAPSEIYATCTSLVALLLGGTRLKVMTTTEKRIGKKTHSEFTASKSNVASPRNRRAEQMQPYFTREPSSRCQWTSLGFVRPRFRRPTCLASLSGSSPHHRRRRLRRVGEDEDVGSSSKQSQELCLRWLPSIPLIVGFE